MEPARGKEEERGVGDRTDQGGERGVGGDMVMLHFICFLNFRCIFNNWCPPPILQTIRGNSYTILLMSLIFESLLSSLPSLLSLSDFHNGFPAAAAMIDVSTEFNHFDGSGELVCPTQHNDHTTFLSNSNSNNWGEPERAPLRRDS